MSCLNWNCRGLGNPQTEDELVALVSNKDPKLAFLMETKAKKKVLEKIHQRIQFAHMFVVSCPSQGRGLAWFWKDHVRTYVI